jgi:LacI family transcriptional regulator, purine nucleotide synthesis repressor
LLLAIDDREFVEQVLSTTHPVVVVNAEHPELAVDTFLPDNWRALCQAVRRLIQRRHRRILHVTYAGRSTLQRREQAYCAALADAGIANDPSLILTLNERETDAAYAIRTYLTRADRDCTAVFCCDELPLSRWFTAYRRAGCASRRMFL